MGKVVKYCAKCEESFSEKFSFCPNCASAMTAYEMNPLMAETKASEPVKVFEPVAEEVIETKPIETAVFAKTVEPEPPAFLSQNADEDILEFADDEEIEEIQAEQVTIPSVIVAPIVEEQITVPSVVKAEPIPVVPAPVVLAPAVTIPSVAKTNVEDFNRTYQSQTETANFASKSSNGNSSESKSSNKVDNDGFYNITLVEPKNNGTRNALLLGTAFLIMALSVGSVIGSLFNSNLYIGALEDDLNNIVFVGEDVPMEEEEKEKPLAEKEKEAGGGGGGNKDPNPVSKGRLADEVKNPNVPPSVTLTQVTKPDIPLVVGVKSDQDKKRPPSTDPYGDPNSKYSVASDGDGSNGGQGRGRDGGQGDGIGPGFRNGSGGGPGGNGDGPGSRRRPDDDGNEPPPEIKKPVGPSTALNITAKPRANYTDAARQNQVQGTVTLRVTFNANGSIGSISSVNGLPYGLTEQAIAAARSIRFQPQLKNGVAQTVIKQVQYNFTLY